VRLLPGHGVGDHRLRVSCGLCAWLADCCHRGWEGASLPNGHPCDGMRKRRRSRAPSSPLTSPGRSRLLGGWGVGNLLCQNTISCTHASSTKGLPAGKAGTCGAMATDLCQGCSQTFVSVSAFDAHRPGRFSCRQRCCVTGRRTRQSGPVERLLMRRDARWFFSWQTAQRVRKGGEAMATGS
jgi:hypothetical protein